jgi:hypothetical protein
MSILKKMMEIYSYNQSTNLGLLDEKEEALISMKHLLNEMISELDNNQRLIDRYLEYMDEFPINHNLSLDDNEQFSTAFNEYQKITLNDL